MSARYPLMESFYTIQGEGYNTGKAAYFLRLGGCDVGCVWCDVKESWNAEKHPVVSIDEMFSLVVSSGADRVVITGGEPTMYDLEPLTTLLKKNSIECFIETSGAYKITGSWNWICVSPKKFMLPLKEAMESADELKVIIYNKSDFDWALKNAGMTKDKCLLYLQPEYSTMEKMMPLIIDFVKKNTRWRISLQTHKVMGIP